MKEFVNKPLVLLNLSNAYLIDNFMVSEFDCPDVNANTFMLDFKVLCLLFAIRSHFGKPVNINSAFRTKKYNSLVGGAPGSAHLFGLACDFYVDDVDLLDLINFIHNSCNCRIGVYDNFLHIDFLHYHKNINFNSMFWIKKKVFNQPKYFSNFSLFIKYFEKEFHYGK